jgi:hypothetical protein
MSNAKDLRCCHRFPGLVLSDQVQAKARRKIGKIQKYRVLAYRPTGDQPPVVGPIVNKGACLKKLLFSPENIR